MSKRACGVVAAALLLSSCAAKLHPYELDETQIGAPGVESVGLLPLNVLRPLPSELDGATRRVRHAIRVHLERCGVRIVNFAVGEARSLWNEAADGGAGEAAGEARLRRYAERLRAKRAFDVLIVPSLVYRDARIRPVTRKVEWDGVARILEVKGYLHSHGSVTLMVDFRGKMPAVSLHLGVYDAEGSPVFDSYAGLDLVHMADIGTPGRPELENRPPMPTWDFRLKRNRLTDPEALREGVALAFTPYLDPRPRATPMTDAVP